jgi:hypothetical protein
VHLNTPTELSIDESREVTLLLPAAHRHRTERKKERDGQESVLREGVKRGAWTAKEDDILAAYVKAHGEGKWREVPQKAGKIS